jgi:hypothetical protein
MVGPDLRAGLSLIRADTRQGPLGGRALPWRTAGANLIYFRGSANRVALSAGTFSAVAATFSIR